MNPVSLWQEARTDFDPLAVARMAAACLDCPPPAPCVRGCPPAADIPQVMRLIRPKCKSHPPQWRGELLASARQRNREQGGAVTMAAMCAWLGITRQAHSQQQRRHSQRQAGEQAILTLVRQIRQRHPRLGGRKLLTVLQPELAVRALEMGRDRFFDLLARADLLVPHKRQRRRTTWGGTWRCPNLLTDLTLTRVHQVWVCDITYLETEQGFCYLSLLTDAYSRYIVGYDVATTLATTSALAALNMALAHTPGTRLAGLIHHSDHGIQYTCQTYRDRLTQVNLLPSMGAVGNCYDNAQAERVNGILKLEYGLGDVLQHVAHAQHLTREAIWLYNHERPHQALAYRIPFAVHTKPPQQQQ